MPALPGAERLPYCVANAWFVPAAPDLQPHCWSLVPCWVLAPVTSRHSPLCWFLNCHWPLPRETGSQSELLVPFVVYWITWAPCDVEAPSTARDLLLFWFVSSP